MDEMTNPWNPNTTIPVLRELREPRSVYDERQDADIASLSVVGDDSSIEYSPDSCLCGNRPEATGGWGKQSSESY